MPLIEDLRWRFESTFLLNNLRDVLARESEFENSPYLQSEVENAWQAFLSGAAAMGDILTEA